MGKTRCDRAAASSESSTVELSRCVPRLPQRRCQGGAREVGVLKLVQVTFHAMTVTQAVEGRVLLEVLSDKLEEALENLIWYSFELWLDSRKEALS